MFYNSVCKAFGDFMSPMKRYGFGYLRIFHIKIVTPNSMIKSPSGTDKPSV